MPNSISQLVSFLQADPASILRHGHKEVFLARAPGRLDVMGGHSEYAGGLACQLPLEAATAVAVQRRDDRNLVLKTYNTDPAREPVITISLDEFYGTAALLPQSTLQQLFAGGKSWAAHIAGTYPTLARHKKITRRTSGANIACYSNIPFRAGAAASAALECATLWAVTAAYHLILDPMEIALLAQKIENQLVGTLAGIVEPATSVLGRQDQLLLLQCQPHDIKGYLAVPPGCLFAGIGCGQTGDAAQATALRVATAMAQKILAQFFADTGIKKDPTRGYLANIAPDSLQRYFRAMLPESLSGGRFLQDYGPINDRLTTVNPSASYAPRAAAEFHVAEQVRTQSFISHLHQMHALPQNPHTLPDLALAAGQLLLESHAAACQAGLSNTRADLLVELIQKRGPARGLFGARIASGGHGVTVFAADAARTEIQALAAEFREYTGDHAPILVGSSHGAAEVAPQRLPAAELITANR